MSKYIEKFWIEDITQLFCKFDIVPDENNSLEEQMNSLSRLVILFFMLLFLVNWKYDLIFLFLCLIFIIILYYIKKGMNQNKEMYKNLNMSENKDYYENPNIVENYGPTDSGVGPTLIKQKPSTKFMKKTNLKNTGMYFADTFNKKNCHLVEPVQALKYCNEKFIPEDKFMDPNYISPNQKLVGRPMPRTEVAPIIVPPTNCHNFWKPNDFAIHSGINSESTVDLGRSGYLVTDKSCLSDYKCGKNTPYVKPVSSCNKYGTTIEPFDKEIPKIEQSRFYQNISQPDIYSKENKYSDHISINGIPHLSKLQQNNLDGNILTEMGYYPNQPIQNNLPSNLAVGNAQKDPAFNNYNKNVFTNIIQPGVYTQNEIIEPISENIGISFTQQFQPVEKKINKNGTTFVYEDPVTYKSKSIPFKEGINNSNIYDPRFTGSGTSYRTYIDKMTGQPRFYYDDINCHRKPNYITRNNIDFTDYGTTYGPQNHREFMDQRNVREKAQNTYLDNQLTFRTEMQERLLRKANANAWQQKVAPIIKSGFVRRGTS